MGLNLGTCLFFCQSLASIFMANGLLRLPQTTGSYNGVSVFGNMSVWRKAVYLQTYSLKNQKRLGRQEPGLLYCCFHLLKLHALLFLREHDNGCINDYVLELIDSVEMRTQELWQWLKLAFASVKHLIKRVGSESNASFMQLCDLGLVNSSSLCLGFLIHKLKIVIVVISSGCYKD